MLGSPVLPIGPVKKADVFVAFVCDLFNGEEIKYQVMVYMLEPVMSYLAMAIIPVKEDMLKTDPGDDKNDDTALTESFIVNFINATVACDDKTGSSLFLVERGGVMVRFLPL